MASESLRLSVTNASTEGVGGGGQEMGRASSFWNVSFK